MLYGWTIGPWPASLSECDRAPMSIEQHTNAQALVVIALIAGTIEYIEVIQRRVVRRRADAERRRAEDVALRGLVRVFLSGK